MAAFTYDLTTDIGKIRLFTTDTDASDYIYSDEELGVFLSLFAGSPMLAAAAALDAIATDAAKVAIITKNDVQTTDPTKIPTLLAERAKTLRSMAGSDPAFVATILGGVAEGAPDRIFTTDETDTDTLGTMTGW